MKFCEERTKRRERGSTTPNSVFIERIRWVNKLERGGYWLNADIQTSLTEEGN